MIETIQERVRNMVGSFYNLKTMIEEISNEKDKQNKALIIEYLINNSCQITKTMDKSIDYLIDMAKIIDENLPKGFDINEHLDKTKYHKS